MTMNQIIDQVTPEMFASTQAKFDSWDKVIRKGWLEGTDKQRAYSYGLLQDCTIYTYAFDRDEHGEPFKLYPYQDMILNDPSKRTIFAAANQIGKSITLCKKAKHFALTNPGKTVLLASKTLPQSKDLLLKISSDLRSSILDYRFDTVDTKTKTEIYFRHFNELPNGKTEELPQSRIICVPATEAALGYATHLFLIDELAFYDDGEWFYYQIAQPRTYTTKGPIIVFSNPNGQQGVFWKLWNDPDFSKYRFNYLDKPGNTKEEYKALSLKLTRDQFDSTVDAVFTSPEGGFLTLEERQKMQIKERPNVIPAVITNPIYIFFDFAKVLDRTVRVIGVPAGTEMFSGVHCHEMLEYPEKTPYSQIIDDLNQLAKSVGPENIAMVGWDNTGVGQGIQDFFIRIEEMGIMPMPVEFSLKNKSRIYTIFKLLIERNLKNLPGITVPYVEACDVQLSKLRFKRSSRDYLQVKHENERDRDDFPDALAGLCSLIVQPENPPVTCTIIGADEISGEVEDDEEEVLF